MFLLFLRYITIRRKYMMRIKVRVYLYMCIWKTRSSWHHHQSIARKKATLQLWILTSASRGSYWVYRYHGQRVFQVGTAFLWQESMGKTVFTSCAFSVFPPNLMKKKIPKTGTKHPHKTWRIRPRWKVTWQLEGLCWAINFKLGILDNFH